jgi:hypothetical protein
MNESGEMLISGQRHVPGGVGPVFSSCAPKKENTYHFVLWNGNKVNLVSVLDCPEVQQFLVDSDLATDRL